MKSRLKDHEPLDKHLYLEIDCLGSPFSSSKKLDIIFSTYQYFHYWLYIGDEVDHFKMMFESFFDKHNSYVKIAGRQMMV